MSTGREEKAARQAAVDRIGWYHDEQARRLAVRLEEALAAYRRHELDVCDLDDLQGQYQRARRKLDSFCWTTGDGPIIAAATLDSTEPIDWWALAESARRRRPR